MRCTSAAMSQRKGVITTMLVGLLIISASPAVSQAAVIRDSHLTRSTTAEQVSDLDVSVAQMTAAVSRAQTLTSVPNNLTPSLTDNSDFPTPGPAYGSTKCHKVKSNSAGVPSAGFGQCVYGDLAAKRLMVVYGDSHAIMWGAALETIAMRAGWRLETFYLSGCPAADLAFISYQTNNPNTQCTKFHQVAPTVIKALHPKLIVVTSESYQQVAREVQATSAQWQSGLIATFKSLSGPDTSLMMIGNIPQWSQDDSSCLAAHLTNVQSCAVPVDQGLAPNLDAEQTAAQISGAKYISATSVVCAAKCEPIINNIKVFYNTYHLSSKYVQYLSGPLEQAMGLAPAN